MEQEIVNRVENSGLIQIDLEKFLPSSEEMMTIDFSQFLYEGIILREKDFRNQLKTFNFSDFKNKSVLILKSDDVIIPQWAIILLSVTLYTNEASFVYSGTHSDFSQQVLINNLNNLDFSLFFDKRIIVKGCSNSVISINAYLHLIKLMQPIVKSIMYGEPCSTVPLFKK